MDNIFIDREIKQHILEIQKYFPVLTITGPRQSGKTTLIKHIYADYQYFSMEDLDTREFAMADPRAFLSQEKKGMIIDEVQKAPLLLSYIQGIVDNNPERKFILSGSSNFTMLKHVTQTLAGRTAILELPPLAYKEIQQYASAKTLDQLLIDGFYPAIYADKNKPEFFYPNYVKTYIERDVRDILNVSDLHRFQIFLRLCAGRIGSLFNAQELSNEVGVSTNTIFSWLDVLQTSYIVTLLQPYHDNIGKRLVKTPKLYFHDTGLACYLLGIENTNQLSRDKMRGHLFENFIVTEALKSRYNKGKDSNLYFYRDSNQNEVDLLMLNGQQFNAFEIKSAQTFDSSFLKGLNAFSKIYNTRIDSKCIVYAGDFENINNDYKLLNYKNIITNIE